jgi:hypothetical protein
MNKPDSFKHWRGVNPCVLEGEEVPPMKILSGKEGRKNLSKTEGIHNNLMFGHFIRVNQMVMTTA